MQNSCFFIGHRETGEDRLPELYREVERHITEYGVNLFIVGQYGGFDRIALRAVCQAKLLHPQVRLEILTPYHPSVKKVFLPEGADGAYYPDGMETVPPQYAIARANRQTVKNVDHLIACVTHSVSNAQKLVQFARGREKRGEIRITMLGEADEQTPMG